MPRKTENLIHQPNKMMDGWLIGVETELANTVRPKLAFFPPVHALGESINAIKRQSQRFADLTHSTFAAIGNYFSGECRSLTTIFAVDILNDLFASFVLEININVRRLVALTTDKPLKEQIDSIGIDSRHTQAVTHR